MCVVLRLVESERCPPPLQVCLVERKRTKKVYAMKYVNKQACLRQRAVTNVCAEVEMLRAVDHPFVGGLWFTFQVRGGGSRQYII